MKNQDVVKVVFKKCLGHKKGENILIVTDDKLEKLGEIFYSGAAKLGIPAMLMKMPPGKIHSEEPPLVIAEALKAVNIALLVTHKSLSHTKARKTACKEFGTRIASLPGLSFATFKRCMLIDYNRLQKSVSETAALLTRAKGLRLTTKAGTDLSMYIKGREGFRDNGLYIKRGAFGNLPAGEACIGPQEGTTSGRLVIDASMALLGRLKKPIEVIIDKGYVKKISSPKLASILKPLGKSALNIAEFGIGLNPRAKVTGNILEDEKAVGTGHIAFGDNRSFGGRISAPCHLDGVFFNPEITWIK